MTADEIREGLQVDPFSVCVDRVQDEWAVEWDYDGVPAASATFRETDDGIEWTRFNVLDEFRGKGLYTVSLRFSAENSRALIAGDTAEREFYLRAGFKEKDGLLVQDKRLSKSWLKGR